MELQDSSGEVLNKLSDEQIGMIEELCMDITEFCQENISKLADILAKQTGMDSLAIYDAIFDNIA
jgi:hypothetical protein